MVQPITPEYKQILLFEKKMLALNYEVTEDKV